MVARKDESSVVALAFHEALAASKERNCCTLPVANLALRVVQNITSRLHSHGRGDLWNAQAYEEPRNLIAVAESCSSIRPHDCPMPRFY